MIVPIRSSTIARTAPAARIRRRRAGVTGEASPGEGDPSPATGPAPFVVTAAPDPRGRRQGEAKPTPAFLASLLVLRRGG